MRHPAEQAVLRFWGSPYQPDSPETCTA